MSAIRMRFRTTRQIPSNATYGCRSGICEASWSSIITATRTYLEDSGSRERSAKHFIPGSWIWE
jgi:hypothetical protein